MRCESQKAFLDAYNAAQAIGRYIVGVESYDYECDDMLQGAVERRLEIIGEALNRVRRNDPDAFLLVQEHEGVIRLRNLLAHGYDVIDNRRVWNLVQTALPELVARLEYVLGLE